MVAAFVGLHFLVAATTPALTRRVGRAALLWAAAPLAVTIAWLVTHAGRLLDGTVVTEEIAWVADLDLSVVLRVDPFSAIMLTLIAGLGLLILSYTRAYIGDRRVLGRLTGSLVAFAGAMTGLVVADHLLALYVFWELTSITSYLLIAGDGRSEAARRSAQHALFVTVAGGLAMLAGFVLVGQAAGTYHMSELTGAGMTGTAVSVGAALVLLGAFTKSAQVPFHGWLPGAMVAPTPVSAYLHSATMVTAGVYLVARLSTAMADATSLWVPATAIVGLTTLILTAVWAMFQRDLKRLLAYGTVSQLGLMTALVGSGRPKLMHAGIAVLFAHALYKSALFLCVGNIEHAAGTRDLGRLRGVARVMPVTAAAAGVAALSMMGIPPLAGYVTKEAALAGYLDLGPAWIAGVAAVVVGGALTVTYGLRFAIGGLTTRPVGGGGGRDSFASPDHELGSWWLAPVVFLAIASIVAGIVAGSVGEVVTAAVEGLAGTSEGALYLWHGLEPAVILSALAIAVGIALHVWSGTVHDLRGRLPVMAPAEETFGRLVAQVSRLAGAVTRVIQNGSLPVYLATIAATAFMLPAAGLVTGPLLGDPVQASTTSEQIVVAAVLVAAAVGIAATHRRFVALLFLGAVGYGMAVLFWLQGAPDLALTQVTIETVTIVLFVLVLRRLPERFTPPRWAFGRTARLAISLSVGLLVTFLAVLAGSVLHEPGVSQEFLARALPEAEGKNVVNVILVDFRAMDTLGEITVLVVATLGISELVGRARRTGSDVPRVHPLFAPEQISPIAAMTIRAIYPAAVLASLYFLVAGHNHPGGGFVGGLVAGAALLLRYVTEGSRAVRAALPVDPITLTAWGLVLAVATGVAGALGGAGFLGAATATVDLPVFGSVKASSTLVFDTGVYLIVLGFVGNALRTLGAEEYAT